MSPTTTNNNNNNDNNNNSDTNNNDPFSLKVKAEFLLSGTTTTRKTISEFTTLSTAPERR